MRDIIRCPSCFTYVYSDARTCHGCGERTGRRRLLTRGSWIFIVLAVTGFAVGRGIDLHQTKQMRLHSEFEEASRSETTRKFINAWLTADSHALLECISNPSVFGPQLEQLRDKWPRTLPATAVVGEVKIEADELKAHGQQKGSSVTHRNEEWSPRVRVSTSTSSKAVAFAGRLINRTWFSPSCEFQAEFRKDSGAFTIHGRVCFDDHSICCFAIDKIEGVEGIVTPKE